MLFIKPTDQRNAGSAQEKSHGLKRVQTKQELNCIINVRTNCFCASLLRTQIDMQCHSAS